MLSDLYHLAEFHACASLVRDIGCSHVKVTGPSFGLSVFCVKKKKKAWRNHHYCAFLKAKIWLRAIILLLKCSFTSSDGFDFLL